jgi:S1-C subfamily serine protease
MRCTLRTGNSDEAYSHAGTGRSVFAAFRHNALTGTRRVDRADGDAGGSEHSIWKIKQPDDLSAPPRRIKAYGSGFTIGPSGIVVTNQHVIEGALYPAS